MQRAVQFIGQPTEFVFHSSWAKTYIHIPGVLVFVGTLLYTWFDRVSNIFQVQVTRSLSEVPVQDQSATRLISQVRHGIMAFCWGMLDYLAWENIIKNALKYLWTMLQAFWIWMELVVLVQICLNMPGSSFRWMSSSAEKTPPKLDASEAIHTGKKEVKA